MVATAESKNDKLGMIRNFLFFIVMNIDYSS